MEDVSKYPALFAELLRSGQWSVQELKNLAGLNMLRVMQQVEKVINIITLKYGKDRTVSAYLITDVLTTRPPAAPNDPSVPTKRIRIR